MRYFVIGTCQMLFTNLIGAHNDLPHMQNLNWHWYVVEALFYSFFWWGICRWLKKMQEDARRYREIEKNN